MKYIVKNHFVRILLNRNCTFSGSYYLPFTSCFGVVSVAHPFSFLCWLCYVLFVYVLCILPKVRHIAPLGNIIPMPSQRVFDLTPHCYVVSRAAANTYYINFDLTLPHSRQNANHHSTNVFPQYTHTYDTCNSNGKVVFQF